eukprot:177048-Hanusia_phi.AAC.2
MHCNPHPLTSPFDISPHPPYRTLSPPGSPLYSGDVRCRSFTSTGWGGVLMSSGGKNHREHPTPHYPANPVQFTGSKAASAFN